MRVIGFKGLFGGAGTTTITANLAGALHRRQLSCIAVDLCATNTLRLHFGMPMTEAQGLFNAVSTESEQLPLFESDMGVLYVPFGNVEKVPEHDTIRITLENLLAQIKSARSGQIDYVLVDIPNNDSKMLRTIVDLFDGIFHILAPEPRVYPALHYFSNVVWPNLQAPSVKHFFLLNQIAPHLELNRDIADMLREELNPDLLLDQEIQRDQHLPEALATQQTAFEFTLGAQSNVEFSALSIMFERLFEVENDAV
ncbi:hypothetical protein C9988_00915 [Pseudidiomarina aestuarii]|nr:hypothetical protein C9988_00915 [Pseudidiomarina aestuarii]